MSWTLRIHGSPSPPRSQVNHTQYSTPYGNDAVRRRRRSAFACIRSNLPLQIVSFSAASMPGYSGCPFPTAPSQVLARPGQESGSLATQYGSFTWLALLPQENIYYGLPLDMQHEERLPCHFAFVHQNLTRTMSNVIGSLAQFL